jgi:hypothetical protein
MRENKYKFPKDFAADMRLVSVYFIFFYFGRLSFLFVLNFWFFVFVFVRISSFAYVRVFIYACVCM